MLEPDIHHLQTGDPRMWEYAFYRLWPIAWSAARRRLAGFAPADIEDVAIDAIRETAEKVQAGEVGSLEELRALTGVISTRRALDYLRRTRAERRASGATQTIEGREDLVSSALSPLEQVNAQDLTRLLMDLAARLPFHQLELLRLYYLDGLKQAEVAEKLGMPMGTVGVTLSRALQSLRAELGKYPQLMKELREALR